MKFIITAPFIILFYFSSIAQWVLHQTPPMPEVYYSRAVAYEGKVYFAGGHTTGTPSNNLIIWDLATNTIEKRSLSVARCGIMCAAYEGKIYFAGGFRFSPFGGGFESYDNVDVLDVATGNMTVKHLSQPRSLGVPLVIGGKIMFAGGMTTPTSNQTEATNVVDIYNPATNTWTVQYLSEKRCDMNGAVIGNKAYICGGAQSWTNNRDSKRVDIFDATTGKWSIDSLSIERAGAATLGVGKYLVCAGGINDTSTGLDVVDILDTETGEWSTSKLFSPRALMGAAVVGKKGYFTGGGTVKLGTNRILTSSAAVDIFDSKIGKMVKGQNLKEDRIEHACASWNNKIIVGCGWRQAALKFADNVEILTALALDVDFAADTMIGERTVQFADKTIFNPFKWHWSFGDGDTSDLQHPQHVYPHFGTFTACLTATNVIGSDSVCRQVSVRPFPPVANFSADTMTDSKMVQFHDLTSSDPFKWQWNFGDGNSSTEQNPLHTFPSFGTFKVCLEATNLNSSDSVCREIMVSPLVGTLETTALNVSVFPNPASQGFWVQVSDQSSRPIGFDVLDVFGKKYSPSVEQVARNQWFVSATDFPAGPYFLRLFSSETEILFQKISILR